MAPTRPRRKAALLPLLLLPAWLPAACGEAPTPPDSDPEAPAAAIRALAAEALRAHPAPGLSVGVSRGGETVFAEGFGLADLEHRVRPPPTPCSGSAR